MSATYTFEAIGTHWQIDIEDSLNNQREEKEIFIEKLKQEIKARIEIFDKAYSRFRSDSLVTLMSQQAGVYVLPEDAKRMLDLYAELYVFTDGHLTPLIGQALVDAGYDAHYSLQQHKALEQPPAWNDVLEYNHPQLIVKKPVLLDFGAAGKGYLIDIIGDILEKNNIKNFTIDAGGDMLYRTTTDTSLKIGLENPLDFSQVIGVVELKNKSLCGSAGSRRKWQNFNHIINPYTRSSPQEIIATWVIADTTLLADALASCLFFVDSGSLTKYYTFEYLIVHADFSIEKSTDFPGEIFSA